jgi:hypothetical protein
MHEDVEKALRTAIIESLDHLQPLVARFETHRTKWRIGEDSMWHGENVVCPDLDRMYQSADEKLHDIGQSFLRILSFHYPNFDGHIGYPSFGSPNLYYDSFRLLRLILNELWNRHETFQLGDEHINTIIQEFSAFIGNPTSRFRYIAVLLNYTMDLDVIQINDSARIRRMNGLEFSEIYGHSFSREGSLYEMNYGPHDFVLEGEFEEARVDFSERDISSKSVIKDQASPIIDKVILGLRTFKSGYIGYNWVRFKPIGLCPLAMRQARARTNHLHTPAGQYRILADEVELLEDHLQKVLPDLHESLTISCNRLSDAEARVHPQDRLLDAVIGLEALLLAGDQQGELKFRFSLNYSTLFDTPQERSKRFQIAKDIYNLRSTIAHGGKLKSMYKVGDRNLLLDDAANEACQILRDVIKYFLSCEYKLPYREPKFWENGYFGIEPRL